VDAQSIEFHRALAQDRHARKVLRVDVIGKNESRGRLIADHSNDIGLAEGIVQVPAVPRLRFEQFQADDRLFGQALER
jgi:hypothetical protein